MSTISIIGATGMIGQDIAREAISRGHQVIGTNRSGATDSPIKGVEYRSVELTDTAAAVALAEESDVLVISVAGGRETGDFSHIIKAHQDLIDAAPKTRLFIVGGAGGLETEDGTLLIDAGVIPEEYADEPKAFVEVLKAYRASAAELNWVMLAPSPVIEPGEKTASHKLSDAVPAGDKVSTGTFAVAALDEIEKPAHQRARFTVANA
ncbi:NAD(P)-dependent oxidoreductase [Corynebacterium sp. A21]|uniref:NAD(P)-dependent oxidoreductase n=1 Tax=Corynebacterium sp. A21 TaxID=3457318 RepID=UPI003FD513C5